jgi:hypothetical protein
MEIFESVFSYQRFEPSVRYRHRYVRPSGDEEFLRTIAATASQRVEHIPNGTPLWRAQLGNGWYHILFEDGSGNGFNVPVPHAFERMRPLPFRAPEGRASPKGIPVLYLATERETALLEVRPWAGSTITVALFIVQRDLRVVDCSLGSAGKPIWAEYVGPEVEDSPPDERDRSVWTDIDLGFAEPVDRSDDEARYAATQIIADLFKLEGYDGIKYRSALSKTGHNIALFDLGAAEPNSCSLVEVEAIQMDFRETKPWS